MRASTLALSLLTLAAPAWAQDAQTIEVEGMAAVVNGDIGQARDRAVDDAKRKAVEQVVGTTVSAESVAVLSERKPDEPKLPSFQWRQST